MPFWLWIHRNLITKIFHTDTKSKKALNIKLDDVDKIKAEQQKYLKKAGPATKALDDYKAAMSTARTKAALNESRELREKEGVFDPAKEVKPMQLSD